MPLSPKTNSVLLWGFLAGLSLLALIGWSHEACLGLYAFEFGDESEKFVAAQLLQQGGKLYSTVFANHGPFHYFLAHAYAVWISATSFSLARLSQCFFALLAAISAATSPALHSMHARMVVWIGFWSWIGALWLPQGLHLVTYPATAALLIVVPLAQSVLPALFAQPSSTLGVLLTGAALALLLALGYLFLPAAMMLGFVLYRSGIWQRRQWLLASLTFWGIILGIAGWLRYFGSWSGYLVYHFYFNQVFYKNFHAISWLACLRNLTFPLTADTSIHYLGPIGLLVLLGLWWKMRRDCLLAMILALLLLNPTGQTDFHNSTFIVAIGTLLLLTAIVLIEQKLTRVNKPLLLLSSFVLATVVIVPHAISTPHRLSRANYLQAHVELKPSTQSLYTITRSIIAPNQRVMALEFAPAFYLFAGRLPASGHFFYLPPQALYHRQPLWHQSVDLCADIRAQKPGVIFYNSQPAQGKQPLTIYEPCVAEILQQDYLKWSSVGHLYLRRQQSLNLGFVVGQANYPVVPSAKLNALESPPVLSWPVYSQALVALHVRFATYNQTIYGRATLRLHRCQGGVVDQDFSLEGLLDNQYYRFALLSDYYQQAQIVHVRTASALSIWQAVTPDGPQNCVIAEFADGTQRVVAGCPI